MNFQKQISHRKICLTMTIHILYGGYFCQLKGTPAKENIIIKELRRWGFNVDVEVFTLNKTNEKDHGIRNK